MTRISGSVLFLVVEHYLCQSVPKY